MKLPRSGSLFLAVFLATSLTTACGGSSSGTSDGSSDDTGDTDGGAGGDGSGGTADNQETWDLATGANAADDGIEVDYTITLTEGSVLTVASSAPSTLVVGATTSGVTPITLAGAQVITVTETADVLTVTSDLPDGVNAEFELSGTFARSIAFSSAEPLAITLRDATIMGTTGPALAISSAVRAFIGVEGTNVLADAATNTAKYALSSEGPLIFDGDGTLDLAGNKKHVLRSAQHVRITGGTLRLTARAGNAISTVNAFVMDGGSLRIETADDVGKGIKVDGAESDGQPLGFIAVNGGTIDITSYDKAMTAAWECAEDGDLACDDADPDPRVTVNGGAITITTTGTPCDSEKDPSCGDDLSPEGIESKSDLTIHGGTIVVSSTDDGLNAGAGIFVTGGRIWVRSSANDAVDSNGVMTLGGGVLIALGTGAPEGGLDSDSEDGSDNTFTVSGGTFIGIGGSNSRPDVASQNVLGVLGGAAGATLAVRNATDDQVVFAFEIPAGQVTTAMIMSSPGFTTGDRFTVHKNASVTCTGETFHGLCLGAMSSTNLGTAAVTISSMTAGLNGSFSGGGGPP